jgi:hypothetical protein
MGLLSDSTINLRVAGTYRAGFFLRPVLRPNKAAEHRLPTDASLSCASLPVMSARSVRLRPFECWVLPDEAFA